MFDLTCFFSSAIGLIRRQSRVGRFTFCRCRLGNRLMFNEHYISLRLNVKIREKNLFRHFSPIHCNISGIQNGIQRTFYDVLSKFSHPWLHWKIHRKSVRDFTPTHTHTYKHKELFRTDMKMIKNGLF